MRKTFTSWVSERFAKDPKSIFLTGDLGFQALEGVRTEMAERFINAGVSEQNMVSVAAAFAREGLQPLCYSIAPFAVFRPAEQIRLDVCLHNLNVKIVGNGGGYGYGIMGATHHAIEDIGVLSTFQSLKCFVPSCEEDVFKNCDAMVDYKGPSYLRLGVGNLPAEIALPAYSALRKFTSGDDITVVILGPVLIEVLHGLKAAKVSADTFVLSEIPVPELTTEFLASLKKTGKLLIVEEHVERGGLGEYLALKLIKLGLAPQIRHLFAVGYPTKTYGSQNFHRCESSLDRDGIARTALALKAMNQDKEISK